MAEQDDPDVRTDWWQRVVAAGTCPDCALAEVYPPGRDPDGYVPMTVPSTNGTPPATLTPTSAGSVPSPAANPATSTPTPTSVTCTWTWPTPPARSW